MKSLPVRIASAAIAVLIMIGTTWFGGADGLSYLSILICFVGAFEFSKMTLGRLNIPKGYSHFFNIVAAILLVAVLLSPIQFFLAYSVGNAAVVFAALLLSRRGIANAEVLWAICYSVVGLFYAVVMPSFAIRLLHTDNGMEWFAFLLLIVFAGDIFAYFAGNFFGKHKLMPNISPNKTIEGAVGGLVGSMICGVVFQMIIWKGGNVAFIAVASTLAAVLAQSGDLFESLVKRVADVKDSGRIMPGHGGILDRLDGVYFAAPLVFCVSYMASLPV